MDIPETPIPEIKLTDGPRGSQIADGFEKFDEYMSLNDSMYRSIKQFSISNRLDVIDQLKFQLHGQAVRAQLMEARIRKIHATGKIDSMEKVLFNLNF